MACIPCSRSAGRTGVKVQKIAATSVPVKFATSTIAHSRPMRPRFFQVSFSETSRVVMDLEQQRDQVKLTVTHDDFAPDSKVFASISNGWPLVLSSLKSY